MKANRLEQQIQFILELDKLKSVIRRSYLLNGERRENSAEHSWHIAMMAFVLAEHADEPVDVLRVVKMLLAHDIVEIDAGDTYCYDAAGLLDQTERERRAAKRIFGLLPDDQAREFEALWEEFEAKETPEAKFATAMDRLMPLLHNYHAQGKSWHENGIALDQVLGHNGAIRFGSKSLWAFVETVLEDAVAKGYLSARVTNHKMSSC